jgi:glycosyltransferase 2 family protein
LNGNTDIVTSKKTRILLILGYGLAVVCLVWVLHDFHLVQAMRQIANVDWRWVLVGISFDILSYVIQGIRWKWLLTPFGRVKLTHSIRAVYAGLFANLVFPLRPGELLRSYLVSDSEDIGLGKVLGSMGVERLVDLVIATAALAIVSLMVDLPRRFEKVAYILAIVALVLLSVVVAIIYYLELKLSKAPEGAKPPRIPGRLMGALMGLHAMGTAPSFYLAVLGSIFMPFSQVIGLWAMMRAYGLHLPLMAAVVVLLIINLGVSLPNAPANVGSYQFFCVLGCGVFWWYFGTDDTWKTTAAGFSFFAFLALTVPFALLGFLALVRSGLSLKSMRERVRHLPSETRSAQSLIRQTRSFT